MSAPLLQVEQLTVNAGDTTLVDGVDFALDAGSALGVVGESGSGKSQTALAILGLSPPGTRVAGRILFEGRDMSTMDEAARNRWRAQEVGVVFQNPAASLNPCLRIGAQLDEVLRLNRGLSRPAARAEGLRLLDRVRVADAGRRLGQFPHELSGGLCQRVAIAMALCCEPRLLIADEPTTALDVTTQARLLDLLIELRQQRQLALLMISHDLGVVAETCERVVVMRRGRVIEAGDVEQVLRHPRADYTATLLAARDLGDAGLLRLQANPP